MYVKNSLENTEGAIKYGQSRQTDKTGKKPTTENNKKKAHTQYILDTIINKQNRTKVNKTSAFLQTRSQFHYLHLIVLLCFSDICTVNEFNHKPMSKIMFLLSSFSNATPWYHNVGDSLHNVSTCLTS